LIGFTWCITLKFQIANAATASNCSIPLVLANPEVEVEAILRKKLNQAQ
jgi:hypothetical protein